MHWLGNCTNTQGGSMCVDACVQRIGNVVMYVPAHNGSVADERRALAMLRHFLFYNHTWWISWL